MDATLISLPNGRHCISYMSNTGNSLSNVEDWYKKQLSNAKVDDINHNSMLGSYFKLNGIELLSGLNCDSVRLDTQPRPARKIGLRLSVKQQAMRH